MSQLQLKLGYVTAGSIELYHVDKEDRLEGKSTTYYKSEYLREILLKQNEYDLSKIDLSKENKKSEREYKNGKLEGMHIEWYSNGNIEIKANYKNSLCDGLYETFYENGKQKEKGTAKENRFDGLYQFWAEDGTLVTERFFIDGKYKMITITDEKGRNVVLEDDIPIVVWKACKSLHKNEFVYVKISVPAEAKRVTPNSTPQRYKSRVEFGTVLEIVDKEGNKYNDAISFVHSGHKLTYSVGCKVIPNGFDPSSYEECGAGINCHKFKEHCDQWFLS
jgi:hypothetical protein